MNAKLMLDERRILSETVFVEMVVWRVSPTLSEGHHGFKYRLTLIVDGRCMLRYDNETGKGDHKHIGNEEVPYSFTTLEALLDDFWRDVDHWRV